MLESAEEIVNVKPKKKVYGLNSIFLKKKLKDLILNWMIVWLEFKTSKEEPLLLSQFVEMYNVGY